MVSQPPTPTKAIASDVFNMGSARRIARLVVLGEVEDRHREDPVQA
jgi:hypothetical protein